MNAAFQGGTRGLGWNLSFSGVIVTVTLLSDTQCSQGTKRFSDFR